MPLLLKHDPENVVSLITITDLARMKAIKLTSLLTMSSWYDESTLTTMEEITRRMRSGKQQGFGIAFKNMDEPVMGCKW